MLRGKAVMAVMAVSFCGWCCMGYMGRQPYTGYEARRFVDIGQARPRCPVLVIQHNDITTLAVAVTQKYTAAAAQCNSHAFLGPIPRERPSHGSPGALARCDTRCSRRTTSGPPLPWRLSSRKRWEPIRGAAADGSVLGLPWGRAGGITGIK